MEERDPTASSMRTVADRHTPLIRNAWYFAALASDVGEALVSRTFLDTRIALYRTKDGEAIALHDRCPHRSFPLSRGMRDGDRIICGYHGMTFDRTGRCIAIPANENAQAGKIGVRRFVLAEKGPILWVWLGDPAEAARTTPPDTSWLECPEWAYRTGSFVIEANYVSMHENLLDITHFSYLHSDTIGTPEYARTPMSLLKDEGRAGMRRTMSDRPAPPAYDKLMGLRGRPVTRGSEAWFDSPGAHLAHGWFENPHPEPGEKSVFNIRFAHLLTPVSQNKLHYQYFAGRDFALGNEEADRFVDDTATRAFFQDVEALQWIEEVVATDDTPFRELSFAADKAGLEMRRLLASRAALENPATGVLHE